VASTKERGTFIKGTAPLPESGTVTLSGIETLDLAAAAPMPTAHLSLGEHDSKRVALPGAAAGRCLTAGGYLQFKLTLTHQHGVALILEMCCVEAEQTPEISLNIEVNEHEMEIGGLPGKGSFYKRSWYLIPDWLKAGDNQITLKLPAEAVAPILLKSVSVMRFNVQKQEQTYWCWAAVTTGIHKFFDPAASLTQSEVVQACLGRTANETLELAQALRKMGTLACSHEAVPALGEVQKQLSAGLPVPVRIGWTAQKGRRRELNGRGHFVVITGVLQRDPRGDDDTLVRVSDPKSGMASYMPYGILKNSYDHRGRLTHFYILKRQDDSTKQSGKQSGKEAKS
jgi:hypothetical protein